MRADILFFVPCDCLLTANWSTKLCQSAPEDILYKKHLMPNSVPTARVLGVSGAGKTSLVHELSQLGEEASVGWAVGWNTDVLFLTLE